MLTFMFTGKLQAFLKFLEEQGSPWKWKVHCKTQKKLKELSRLETNGLMCFANPDRLLVSNICSHILSFTG